MAKLPGNLLVCPKCQKGYLGWRSARTEGVRCRMCQAVYPFNHGVIDLLGKTSRFRPSLSQRFMENPNVVRIYESRFWRRVPLLVLATRIPFEEEQKLVIKAARPDPKERVLDIACGSGIYTRPLARGLTTGLAVGLDLSGPMLRRAAFLARKKSLSTTLFVRASALELPFSDDHFDVVNCCGALHLFPDQKKALQEIGRVLSPGGRFTLAMVRDQDECAGALSRLALTAAGIKGLDKKTLESLIRSSGMEKFRVLHEGGFWIVGTASKPKAS